jgi:hypothetical protein
MIPSRSRSSASAECPDISASAEDWREESSRQAQRLADAPVQGPSLFSEFRRKLAGGETLARSLERLAEALSFSGRITVSFHQGKVTKTLLEESYYRGKAEL